MSRALLEGRELTRTYRTARGQPYPVLRGVSLQVEEGQMVVVRGPSGCGKTTLLHLMATVDRPDSGQVRIDGENVSPLTGDALAQLRRRRLGLVYQDCAFIPRYPVWRNVALPLVPEGVTGRVQRERSAAILERLGMADKIDEAPARLSGGELQRVALARALVMRPEILVADEPVSQVDGETAATILDLFDALRAEGVAMLVAAHSPELWTRADENLLLQDGRLAKVSA